MKKICAAIVVIIFILLSTNTALCWGGEKSWIKVAHIFCSGENRDIRVTETGKKLLFSENLANYQIRFVGEVTSNGKTLFPIEVNQLGHSTSLNFICCWVNECIPLIITVYSKHLDYKTEIIYDSSITLSGSVMVYLE